MTKLIKMDLYRFLRSTSTWMILLAAVMLAFLSVMLVYTSTSIMVYANAGELLAAQINGGILMVLCAVAAISFVSAKYKNGFIKNIANQFPWRELLVFPEIIVTAVTCALCFFVYSICTIAAGAAFFGNTFIKFSLFTIMKMLIVQFILHWGFCCLLLLFYMITNSTTFTMAAGLFMAFKILNMFYVFVERFTHFKIGQYMLDSNIFQLGMESAKPICTRASAVGLIFLMAELIVLCMVMRKKDIK